MSLAFVERNHRSNLVSVSVRASHRRFVPYDTTLFDQNSVGLMK